MGIHHTARIHESAVIDKGAIIGANSQIWHWTHICAKAEIGKIAGWDKMYILEMT